MAQGLTMAPSPMVMGCLPMPPSSASSAACSVRTAVSTVSALPPAIAMAAMYAELSIHSSRSVLTPCLSLTFASDSAIVNFSQTFFALLDLPETASEAYQALRERTGSPSAALLIFIPLLAWAGLAAIPIFTSASMVSSSTLSYADWAVRGLLVFRSLLRSPKILDSIAKKLSEIMEETSLSARSAKLSLLVGGLLCALMYSLNQHSSITKGLSAIDADYEEEVSSAVKIFLEILAVGPLAVFSTDFTSNGLRKLVDRLSSLKTALPIAFGCANPTVNGAELTSEHKDYLDERLEQGLKPVFGLLVEFLLAYGSGFSTMTVALTGASHTSTEAMPSTVMPFENDPAYKIAAAANAYLTGSAMNTGPVNDLFEKFLWPYFMRHLAKGLLIGAQTTCAACGSACESVTSTTCCTTWFDCGSTSASTDSPQSLLLPAETGRRAYIQATVEMTPTQTEERKFSIDDVVFAQLLRYGRPFTDTESGALARSVGL